MRQRNIKNLDERIAASSARLVEDPCSLKGHWSELFGNDRPIYLEIGCGKGDFIISHAKAEPECNFIACEGQASVVLRTLEKAEANESDNLRVFIAYVHDLSDYFERGELSGIYLNFSDPWPKARHSKRRLTYRSYLRNYKELLSEDGFIEFKTDNDGLFEFTLEEIAECGYEIVEMTRDLHASLAPVADSTDEGSYAAKSRTFKTEYEKRFIECGKNISFVRL